MTPVCWPHLSLNEGHIRIPEIRRSGGTPLGEDLEHRPYTVLFELNAPVLALVGRLVTRALEPQHPVGREPVVSQWFLYVRSDWLRMPPGLLRGHLSRKAWRQMGSRSGSPCRAHRAGRTRCWMKPPRSCRAGWPAATSTT